MAERSLVVALTGAVGSLLKELLDTLKDPQSRSFLIGQVGLRSSSAEAPADDQGARIHLTELEQRADSASGTSEDESQTLQLLAGALSAAEAVVDDLVRENPGVAAHTIVSMLLEVYASAKLRHRLPALWAVAEALKFVDDGVADPGRIAEFIGDSPKYLAGLADPLSAQRTSETWAIVLGSLGLLATALPEDLEPNVLYGWDPDPAADAPFPNADTVLSRALTVEIESKRKAPGAEAHTEAVRTAITLFYVPREHGGPGVFLSLGGGADYTIPLGRGLELVLSFKLGDLSEVFLGEVSFASFGGAPIADAGIRAELRRKEGPDGWLMFLGKKSHLRVARLSVKGELGTHRTGILLRFDVTLVLSKKDLDFFLLPDRELQLEAEMGIGYDTVHGGVYLEGGAKLEATIPLRFRIAGLEAQFLTFTVAAKAGPPASIEAKAAVTFTVRIAGVVVVSVDRLGLGARLALPSSKAPDGPSEVKVAPVALPPRGLGLRVKAGPVTGGGFILFDPVNGEYAGVVEVEVMRWSIKAYGLLRQRPDGGYSFIVVAALEWPPGFMSILGLMSVTGIGLLFGLQHRISVEALRAGMSEGAIDHLLFPPDPVANAPRIFTTLRDVFPQIEREHYVVGVMLKLSFAARMVEVAVGLIFDGGWPTIIGKLVVAAPDPALPVIYLQADFLAAVEGGDFIVQATLRRSRLTAFPLTGELMVRISDSDFILSAGGFHPRYNPGGQAPKLPALKRLAVDLSSGPLVRIRLEAYLAVTSNSVQFGARAELAVWAAPLSIHGEFHFEVLIEFDPLRFSVAVAASVSLRLDGSTLAAVWVTGLLEGPEPWHFRGTASLELLFFSVNFRVEETWGTRPSVTFGPVTVIVVDEVAQALSADTAWQGGAPPTGVGVSIRGTASARAHPLGTLTLRQRIAPLGIELTRARGVRLPTPVTVSLGTPQIAGVVSQVAPVLDQFPAAHYFELTEDQKLSRPSVEPYQSGITIAGDALRAGRAVATEASYETILVGAPKPRTLGRFAATLLEHFVPHGAVARSRGYQAPRWADPLPQVTVAPETSVVARTDRLEPVAGYTATTYAASARSIAVAEAATPSQTGTLQVLGTHEVVSA